MNLLQRKSVFLIVLFICIVSIVSANDTLKYTLKSVSLIPNEISNFSLSIDFVIDLNGLVMSSDYWLDKSKHPEFHVTYQGTKPDSTCPLQLNPYTSTHGFGFKLSNFNAKTISLFKAKDNQISIQCDADISFCMKDKNGTPIYGIITKDDVNSMINDNLSISDSTRASFISALNNFYYYKNSIDFGIEPSNDSVSTRYFVALKIQNKWSPANFLKCSKGDNTSIKPDFFWSLDTRLSTNFADSLNYIKFYPVNLAWSSKNYSNQFNLKLGNESNQTFSNKRSAFDASYSLIIPNLVNLTTPTDNRLRLKPLIDLGVKGYYDYSNGITAFSSGEGYMNGHYYIPIYNNFAMIIDGSAFYDLSKERNPNHKVSGNYSVIFGTEIPKSGIKAIFKYINGKTDIDYKQGQVLMIGLLSDFLNEKNNKVTSKNL
jgi:hypothetical protein